MLAAIISLSSSCANVFDSLADKTTDDAILESARLHLASGDWTNAISDFAKLSSTALADPDVVTDYASAYAGRCGLDFLTLATVIQNYQNAPATQPNFLQLIMRMISASTAAQYNDCISAETKLKTIATAGVVSTQKGRYLMAFSSLAKIGAILNFRADADKDGNVDASWDPCDASNGDTYLPQAEVAEIMTGLVLFYQNLKNESYASAIVSPIGTICTSINGQPYDFCAQTTTAGSTQPRRQLIRGIVRETDLGIGLKIKAGGDPVTDMCGS